jgi:hypothetical protein
VRAGEFNILANLSKGNNATGASNVTKLLFGKTYLIKGYMNSTGLSYGLKKVTVYAS